METKLSSIPRRIVITALAVVMAVGLASTWAFAANTASADEPSQAYGRGYTQATGDEVGADASIEGVKSAIEAIFKTDTATVAEAVAVQYGPEASGDSAVPAGQVQLTLKGMHEAQLNSCKLYTYTNGQKGETNLLEGVEQEDSPDGGNQKMYVTTVDAGDYWVEGYDANNDYNGGIAISGVAGQENVIKLQRAYQI